MRLDTIGSLRQFTGAPIWQARYMIGSALDNPVRDHPSNKRLKIASLRYAVGKGLEVGPFDRPFFVKEEADVEYLDYRTTEEARAFAEIAPGHDPLFVPDLDYVVPPDGNWSMVPDDRFNWILSSHALEHCPNLVGMINTIAMKMKKGGALITMLPDKRHTFDVHRPISTLGQIVEDHLRNTSLCRPQAVFDGIYYSRSVTIRDAQNAYATARDNPPAGGDFERAMGAAKLAMTDYVDTHNYTFTSQSFDAIYNALCAFKLIPFASVSFWHTPDDDMTFFSVLRKL